MKQETIYQTLLLQNQEPRWKLFFFIHDNFSQPLAMINPINVPLLRILRICLWVIPLVFRVKCRRKDPKSLIVTWNSKNTFFHLLLGDACLLPATCVFTSHLSESSIPSKMMERNYYGHAQVALSENVILKLEYVASTGNKQFKCSWFGTMFW